MEWITLLRGMTRRLFEVRKPELTGPGTPDEGVMTPHGGNGAGVGVKQLKPEGGKPPRRSRSTTRIIYVIPPAATKSPVIATTLHTMTVDEGGIVVFVAGKRECSRLQVPWVTVAALAVWYRKPETINSPPC